MNIHNTDLVGNEGQTLCLRSSKPTHIANFDRVNSDKKPGILRAGIEVGV